MNIINLTPHDIVVSTGGEFVTFPKSGTVARVTTSQVTVGTIAAGITLKKNTFGLIEGIPAPEINTMFIVSAMVLSANAGNREDLIAPDTGVTAIRNEAGQIKAVTAFVQ